MKFSADSFRWRKVTGVDREHPLFELLANEVVLLDVGFSNEEAFEIAFHQEVSGWVIDWWRLQAIIEDGKHLAEADQ